MPPHPSNHFLLFILNRVGADEVQQKKVANLASANLKMVARIYEIDSKIKSAEEQLMDARTHHKRELKNLKNYLGDMKTGCRVRKE